MFHHITDCSFDECHYLKTANSKRTKALRPLAAAIPRVFMLSGTPALSRPMELFSQVGVRYIDFKEAIPLGGWCEVYE